MGRNDRCRKFALNNCEPLTASLEFIVFTTERIVSHALVR
jgi:hypothetical protein